MTPDQLTALNAEVKNDPKALGYSVHLPDSPGAVADMLNAQTQSMVKAIRSTTAQAWAASGPYAKIVDAGNDTASPVRASCLMLRDTLVSAVDIHMERSDVQQMFGDWVSAGVITQAEHDDLYTRATQPASRAEVLGLPIVTVADIIAAGVI